MRFHSTTHPDNLGDKDIEKFLNYLANNEHVAASTQNQALSALVFLYKQVLGSKSLHLHNLQRAKKPLHLPVVLSHEEASSILKKLEGVPELIALLLYGSGMRISECLRLRVQDIDFEFEQLWVRSGKGNKDRVTILPQKCIPLLKDQIQKVTLLHQRDCQVGHGTTLLPKALHKKYPNEGKQLRWQYVFPSTKRSVDPRSGMEHRYHLSDRFMNKSIKKAAQQAGIVKKVSAHTFRHSFATQLLITGYDIRTVQELLGHKNLKTTMIYTHVINKGGNYLKSPVDMI